MTAQRGRRRLSRRLAIAGGGAALVMGLGGHTPYNQWVVYRQKHLLIGCHREDPATYALAQRITAHLDETLPAARSRIARARRADRLASLLGTGQLDVAVLDAPTALGMIEGAGRFQPYGAIALTLLGRVDDKLLVAHERFKPAHAWAVTTALSHATFFRTETGASLDWHAGSRAALDGRPQPG